MIDLKVKQSFFDRKPVMKKMDQSTRRVFSRFGAYVRRSAKSSIRPRKRISTPGSPPSSHTGLLKKFIFFGFDPRNQSVVIGPARLSQKGRGDPRNPAPALLEYGGTTMLRQRGKGQRKRAKFRGTFRGRPYMGPAFIKEQPKLPAMWRDSLR